MAAETYSILFLWQGQHRHHPAGAPLAGLLSPVYDFTDRGGCWFCPNARRRELRHLYDHHPDLWARMLELQALPGKVSEKFNRTMTFSEIDAGFRREDEQLSLWKNAA